MGQVSARVGGAVGLAPHADVVVRLRLSAVDRMWRLVRWAITLAGAVVVLWFAAAFLAAAPAAAAVAVPVIHVAAVKQAGGLRPAGGGDSDSDSGSSDSSRGGKSEKKSEKKKSGKKSDDKNSDKKNSDKKKSGDKRSEKKKSEKKADERSGDKSDSERDEPSRRGSGRSEESREHRPDGEGPRHERAARAEDGDGDRGSDEQDRGSDSRRVRTKDAGEDAAKKDAAKAEREAAPPEGDAKKRGRQSRDRAAAGGSDSGRDDAERDVQRAVKVAREAADGDEAVDGAERATKRAGRSAEKAAKKAKKALQRGSGDDESAPGEATRVRAAEEADPVKGKRTSGRTRSALRAAADPRGPPSDEPKAMAARDDEDDSDDDREYDDSAEQTERVLEGRIEVDKSEKELRRTKKEVASGKATKADYRKQAAEHEELERDYESERAQVSPERADLVDEVVDGQRGLSERERKLEAEEEKVGSGGVTRKAHDRNVAAYEKQRDEVYEATDELMEATDRDPDGVSEDDLSGAGSAAGCGSDGAFVECGSVSESADGERDSERSLCLSGVSSGCGASSESGGAKAEASCDDTGCGSSASRRGDDGEVIRASARCAVECEQRSRADGDGASAECAGRGGSCESGSSGNGRDGGTGSARCAGGDCSTSSSVELDGAGDVRVEAVVDCGPGCSGSASSESNAGREPSTAGAVAAGPGAPGSATQAAGSCKVSGGECRAAGESRADGSADDLGSDSVATVDVDCGETAGCAGRGTTTTSGSANGVRAGAARDGTATASCEVRGGACGAQSSTETDSSIDESDFAVLTDGDASAASSAGASVDCGDTGGCTGAASGATTGKVTGTATAGGAAPVRTTSAATSCTTAAGGCDAVATSEVSDRESSSVGREPAASSTADAAASCEITGCTGTGSTRTDGAASGDITGVRDSAASSNCTVHGDGGGCGASAGTTVADREPATRGGRPGPAAVAGPVSVSTASATVQCSGGAGECGGTATSSTSARDTAVTPHARGTSASVRCAVTGGGCVGDTSSSASSAPDFAAIDPGRPTSGPSSVASSSGTVVCPADTACSGSVRTSVSAWDGAVAGGTPRTSTGEASCAGGTSGCEASSMSYASTGSGAALALSGGQPVNQARLVAGPSAASASGAVVACAGEGVCDGRASSAATATDPAVSDVPRGSHSTGSCEGVAGGGCQAVTNSGASSEPNANVILPVVQAASTANATVAQESTGSSDEEQPAAPAGSTAPGSSANAGGPTVQGASSWTMASAALDCAGGEACTGTARTSATGSEGPRALTGAGEARGPPATSTGTTSSSGSCASTASGCHVQTDSSAGSGQVVADMVAEDRKTAAEQARVQAAEAAAAARAAAEAAARPGATAAERKAAADAARTAADARKDYTEAARLAAGPVTEAPATLARSSAAAQCDGPTCRAATTGVTDGTAGRTDTAAHCVAAANGCLASSDVTAMAERDSGMTDKAARVPGSAGVAEATSQLLCPAAGCTGGSSAVAGTGGERSTSTATGSARCDGSAACLARITASSSRTTSAPGAKAGERFALTSAAVGASCDDGTAAGCATRGASRTTTAGGEGVSGGSTAACDAPGACYAATGGFAAKGFSETTAECAGIACRTHTDGAARIAVPGGVSTAASGTDCAAGPSGVCTGTSRVAGGENGTQAAASCVGSIGSTCRHSYSSSSTAHSRTGGNTADAHAGCGATGGAGSGWCATGVSAQTADRSAMASAVCQGSAGSGCSYRFRAGSSDAAAAGGASAAANASGSGSGTFGGGFVATTAMAAAADGGAQAAASCTGSAGVRCSHSYRAHASASASYGGNWATAYASGSGGGGTGSGGVSVSAAASAGPGYANASASCSGASNCRWGYAGEASSSASYDDGTHRSWANAYASGSGGGSGPGGGGLSVYAQATAGKGWANAVAGCSGASNCTASYSSRAEAAKTVGGQHAEAWSRCSGGGTGGSCGSYATVEVDADHAVAQAGCSGTGVCDSHFATSSASTGTGTGLKGDAGGDCSGGGPAGGYCATGSKVTYDEETGELVASSYCATEGGTCSKYANITIDTSWQGGQLTGDGEVHCGGAGPGSCSAVGVVDYHEASLDEEGNPVPPALVVGTGCAVEGGTCSHHSRANADITGADGKIGATAVSACSGTTGWCSNVVGGEFEPGTGEITAYADCDAGGASACTKSEAHLHGEVSGPGQAKPNGPTEGTVQGNGKADCVKTSGLCAVSGVFEYVPAEMGEDQDGDGNPDPVPAHVLVGTSCFPEGSHCTQEAHASATLDRETDHTEHDGTANADCSGTWGSCSVVASVALDEESGQVAAFAQCDDDGGAGCTRVETHTDAWADSPNGEDLHGDGRSDCSQQDAGFCSSVSFAKYYADGERTVTTEDGERVELPAHVQSGAGCGSDQEDNCSFSFAAHGLDELTEDDGRLKANARSDCSDSGTTGSGFCTVAADVEIDAEKRTAEATVWCNGSAGVSCSYSGHVEAFQDADKNNAESTKSCGTNAVGNCSLAAAAVAAGGDREKQGQALASGFCSDSNGTCSGEFRTHVDSNRDTLSDCRSSGAANGTCFGLALRDHAVSGGQFFGTPDADDAISLHSKAPGREENRVCSASSACDLQEFKDGDFELEGEYFVLNVEEDKSVGQWFKNFGRDLGDVVVYAVPGLLESIGTELWNIGQYSILGKDGLLGLVTGGNVGFSSPEQGENESDLEYYARLFPFTGGIAQGAVNFYERWLEDGGSWSKIGEDYYYAPVSTLLEDVGTIALVAVGAGAIIKGVSLGAKAATAAASGTSVTGGLRAGLSSLRAGSSVPALDAASTAAMRAAGFTGNIALAPLKVNFAAGRIATGLISRGLVAPVAGRVLNAAEVTAGRAGAAFEFGRYPDAIALQARAGRLTRFGNALEIGAYAGRIIGRDGLFGRLTRDGRTPGLLGTVRAYQTLGLRFGLTAAAGEIASGHMRARFLLDADGMLTPRGRGGLAGRFADSVNALRQQRADRANAVVQYDQLMYGGTLRNPNRLAGRGVGAAERARVLTEIAEGRLGARDFAELTGNGLDRLAGRLSGDRPAPAPKQSGQADLLSPSGPRSGAGTGGGNRPGSSGGGPDPVTGEGGPGGTPRPPADGSTPPKTDRGHPETPDPLKSDLPPPGDGTNPTGPKRQALTEKDFAPQVAEVHAFWQRFREFTDAQLRARFRALADDVRSNRKTIDEVTTECTALACEASRRTTKEDPYDEQIAGALALVRGDLIQMLTGEGKTRAGSLAMLVRSLDARDAAGRPLAGKGAQWLALNPTDMASAVKAVRPMADLLGLTVGEVRPGMRQRPKRQAYESDIAIGTVSEFVFDALRARYGKGSPVHGNRGGYRLIDEVDQVLLDEALTPHVLAEAVRGKAPIGDLAWSARVAAWLDRESGHYTIGRNRVELTDEGHAFIESQTGRDLRSWKNKPLARRVENALAFDLIVEKDVHYHIAKNGDVVIVDPRTGHELPGRRWNDGLHEAIEYAEGREVGLPTRVLDSITVVDLLGDTPFAGMTGTAGGEAGMAAFRRHYGKSVVDIEPHFGRNRKDGTVTYRTLGEKWDGVFDDVVTTMQSGRPVLVVTGSILEAAQFSLRLRRAGIDTNLLTAKTRPREAARVIAEAGDRGRVTVATNRAGRGVDIRLGGDTEALARSIVERDHPGIGKRDPRYESLMRAARVEADGLRRDAVNEAGGLHVVLTEFPESLRVEDQARGRAGRQGQNGSSTLHRSLEDRILQPVGKGELAAERPVDETPLPAMDSTVVDGLFTLARQEAELAARAERGAHEQARAVEQQRGWNPFGRSGMPARPVFDPEGPPASANPAGIDLPQLAALRAGQDLTGLSPELNARLRELARRFEVENAATSPEQARAAAEIAAKLPKRSFQPYRYTEADFAAVAQRLAELTRQQNALQRAPELRDRLGIRDPEAYAATIVAAAQLLADREEAKRTGRPVPTNLNAPAERLRLAALGNRELQALLDYARGVPEAQIADRLGITVDELGWFLRMDAENPGVVVDKLTRRSQNDPLLGTREPAGRQVRTEAGVRDAFLALAGAGTEGLWQRVRDELRAVELYGLHPAEAAALWERGDRIEEFIDGLPARHRDRAYAAFVGAGVTSVSQLAAMSLDELADLGLPAGTTRAVRRTLAGTAVPERLDALDRHLAAGLANRTDWSHDDLLDALHIAAGLPYDPSVPATSGRLAELRSLTGIDTLSVLADLLLQRDRLGLLGPADAAWPVETLDLLVRARAGTLTGPELADLVAAGSGALRMGVAGAAPDQRAALLVLDAHVATRNPQPAGDPAPARRPFSARLLVAVAAAAGAAGGGLAVLGGAGPSALVALAVAGAALGALVGSVIHLVRNRGPPRATGTTTSPAAASGLAARRWTDRLVIGAPSLSNPVTRRRVLGTLVGASLLGWPLTTAGVPGAGLLAVGPAVAAVAVVLVPRVRRGLDAAAVTARNVRDRAVGLRDRRASGLQTWLRSIPASVRDARHRAGDRLRGVARGGRAELTAALRRGAADRALRSVVSGLDEPVQIGLAALTGARHGLAREDVRLAGWQRAAVRWLYGGPDSRSDVSKATLLSPTAVARLLGLDPAEVRRYAADRAVSVDASGLGAPTGSFGDRLARLTAELPAVAARLRSAARDVDQAGAELARQQARRRSTLEAAVRAAAAGGVPVGRIAAITGLTPEQVRAIVGETAGGGSGPSAGGGAPNPAGTGPERPSNPPSGSEATPEARPSGPHAGEPEARSRSPPWWKRLPGPTARTVVLFAAAVAAIRYGAAEPGALAAAGVFWWPGQRRAADELREQVATARAPLPGVERIEAGALDALRQREHDLQARAGWIPALAARLRRAGRTDDRIVAELATALSLHPERVRARLADPDLAAAGTVPAALDVPGLSADRLLTAARDAVTGRSGDLDGAVERHEKAAKATAGARVEAQMQVLKAAVGARNAGVRAGTVRRATGLSRADIAALPATPPTVGDAARAAGTRIASGWRSAVDGVRDAGRWTVERRRAVTAAVGARARAAVTGLGRGWGRLGDRLRAGRVLREQIRGVARLRATAGTTVRSLRREQRATGRSVTAEQLGWIGWLSVVDSAQPAGGRLGEARLVERIARELRLPEAAARRLLARARLLGATQTRPSSGVRETGIAFDQAVAVVATRFGEAHPTLGNAVDAHAAATAVLAAGRAEGVRRANGAGVARATAEHRIDRASRGRGIAGMRSRMWAGLGLDVPVAQRTGPRRARIAGFATGAGVGLVAGGTAGLAGAPTVLVGSVVAAAGLLAAARAVWMPKQARGPPWTAFARGLRAHGVRLGAWALGGLGVVVGAGPVAGLLERLWPVFVHQPGLLGVKALLVPVITAGLVFRYVLRRQHANRASGMQTRPRLWAWLSATAAYALTAGFGLVRSFHLITGPPWLVPVVIAIGVGVANVGAQWKDTGRTRVIKSAVSGSLSAAVAFAVSLLGTGLAPGAVSDLVNAVVIATFVYASPTVIAEYVNAWVGRLMAPFAKRKALQEQRNATAGRGDGERQRRWYLRWLDYKNFSPVDTRLLWRKATDPVLAGLSSIVINLAWVDRAWVLANDNSLSAVLVRFAVMATSVWLVGKLLRDPDEVRNGYYGYRSDRALRSPSRAPRWTVLTGGRLHHRAGRYRRELDRVLELFGLSGRRRDRDLAQDLAARLWERTAAAIHEPLEEWEPLPGGAEIDDALARERAAAKRRREHHVETVGLVVPILAADPAVLKRVADDLRDVRRDVADALDFERMLAQELWALFDRAWVAQAQRAEAPEQVVTPAPSSRVWAARLADAMAERNELRSQYLHGPRRELLELIKQHYLDSGRRDDPNLRRARAALRALDYQLRGASTPRREPLEAAVQLTDQRARSVRDAAVAEQRAIAARDPAANAERLAQMWQLESAMRLRKAAALLAVEAEHARAQRSWNRERRRTAMDTAVHTPPNPVPATLLERLLLLAGRRDAATAAQLQARHGGSGWEQALRALAEMEALEGDDVAGYRATRELRALWRAAGPRLRHAVRSDASMLPDGAELAALAVTGLGSAGVTDVERDAVAALHDVLRDGDLGFRFWHDGWLDDAGITWRRLAGLRYRMRHSAGRLDWPLPADHPAAPARFARGVRDLFVVRWRHRVVPGQQRRLLNRHLRATDAADRLYLRALRAGEFLADQRPGRSLRPEAADLLHAARTAEVEGYARLVEARRNADAALDEVGSYPHQVDRTLRGADRTRPHAPGSDPLPPTAEYWLREITKELDAARAVLDRLHAGPEREAALNKARLLLKRHDIDRDYAWVSQLHRSIGGAKVMETARIAAKNLRAAHRDIFRAPAAPAPGHSSVVPHRDRVEHPYGDEDTRGPGMAAATRRGLGNVTNQDAATLVALPNGDRVALVVDGVFSYPGSRLAAIEFATAFRAELTRTDRPGRTADQALRDAHEAGLGGLTMRYTPETGHRAVAYLAAYQRADGSITISGVGTARAYHLPLDPTKPGTLLTVDDTRGGDITDGGVMTRWAGSDYHPEPTIVVGPRNVPGLLLLVTDGLWRYLPEVGDLAGVVPQTSPAGPARVAARLARAARDAGGRDDLTVAVIAPHRGPPASGITAPAAGRP